MFMYGNLRDIRRKTYLRRFAEFAESRNIFFFLIYANLLLPTVLKFPILSPRMHARNIGILHPGQRPKYIFFPKVWWTGLFLQFNVKKTSVKSYLKLTKKRKIFI